MWSISSVPMQTEFSEEGDPGSKRGETQVVQLLHTAINSDGRVIQWWQDNIIASGETISFNINEAANE